MMEKKKRRQIVVRKVSCVGLLLPLTGSRSPSISGGNSPIWPKNNNYTDNNINNNKEM